MRSNAAVNQANAVGIAYLRADLLPEPNHNLIKASFQNYVSIRLQASAITLADHHVTVSNEGK